MKTEKQIIEQGIINFVEYLENIAKGIKYAGTDRRMSIAVGKVIDWAKKEKEKEMIEKIKLMEEMFEQEQTGREQAQQRADEYKKIANDNAKTCTDLSDDLINCRKKVLDDVTKLINKEKKNWISATDWDTNLKEGLKKLEEKK